MLAKAAAAHATVFPVSINLIGQFTVENGFPESVRFDIVPLPNQYTGKSKFDWTVSQSELVLRVAICTGRHPPRKSSDISSFLDFSFINKVVKKTVFAFYFFNHQLR